MKSFIKRVIRKLGTIAFENVAYELAKKMTEKMANPQEIQILLWEHYKDFVAQNKRPLPNFDEVGFRRYSQFEEDGILLYIFAIIGTTNKIAVEIGAGDGTECNTANLIINHGWQGFLFDGQARAVEQGKKYFATHKDTWIWPPTFTHAWITAENVNEVVVNAGVKGEVDLLSLDIDGMDYWIWKAIDCIQPRVVVCEIHNVIGPDKALTAPYNPNFVIEIPDYGGASLAAMSKLASEKGYRLVGAHRYGLNVFFIRNGIAKDLFPSVSVSSCLQHPYPKHARNERWTKVKNFKWVEV